MRSRLPFILSTMAGAAVPLAKRAYLADTAKNAIKVDNIKASRTPTPGMLLPLDANGKLPESVGAVGPKGDKGEKGDKGDRGAAKVVVRSDSAPFPSKNFGQATATCNSGEKATGGGFATLSRLLVIVESLPSTPGGIIILAGDTATAWTAVAYNTTDSSRNLNAFVLCASP